MKKILLSLGTILAVVAPVASMISCGTTKKFLKEDLDKKDVDLLEKITHLRVKDTQYAVKDKTNEQKVATSSGVKLTFTSTKDGECAGVSFDKLSNFEMDLTGEKLTVKINSKEVHDKLSYEKYIISFMQVLASKVLDKKMGSATDLDKALGVKTKLGRTFNGK